MKEIERKFLVDVESWQQLVLPEAQHIIQAYLHRSESHVVRVRLKGDQAFLTIKGANTGMERDEFEYPIATDEAKHMLKHFAGPCIEKYRYRIQVGEHTWDVDHFVQPRKDLLLAEIELSYSEEDFLRPEWLANEVTHLPEYFNSNMI